MHVACGCMLQWWWLQCSGVCGGCSVSGDANFSSIGHKSLVMNIVVAVTVIVVIVE